MTLEEYIEALAYDTAFWMAGVRNPDYPFEQLGNLSLEVSEKLRSLAIMVLLAKGDSNRFYHNLIRSGMVWETYLERCQNEGPLEDHHRASGRFEPLLDAVAAGDLDLARSIVDLSPKEWQKGHEYEDDYCYGRLLHELIQEVLQEQEIQLLLEQFEAYLEGQPSARLDVCRALVERQQDAFDRAFAALLDEQDFKIAADKARGEMEDPEVVAQRRVFVEGLAILRLAELQGLMTQQEYRFCPSLARVPMETPFPGE